MNSHLINPSPPEQMTIVTWNILLDKTRTRLGIIKSQADRLHSQIATLQKLRDELGTEFDAVALQEVQKTDEQHNGEVISKALGYGNGQWVEHNKPPKEGDEIPVHRKGHGGRKGEYLGMCGARIDSVEVIELGDNRRAVLSRIGGTVVVGIHLRSRIGNEELRKEQIQQVLDRTKNEEHVALDGDFNTWLGGKALQAVEDNGFASAFTILEKPQPKTFPTPEYREIMFGRARFLVAPVALDHIQVRGLHVHDAGSFVGDSDHAGLWAKVSPIH